MPSNNSYLAAEKLKFRRTATVKLCWCVPLLLTTGAACLARDYVQIDSFNWWYVGILPGFLTLLGCQVIGKEEQVGNQLVLSLPVDPVRVWDAKVIYCARMLAVSNLALGILVFTVGALAELFGAAQIYEIRPSQIFTACILLSLCCLWQIPVCMWMKLRMGMLAAFLVNLVFSIIGTVYVSLTEWWLLCPHAVPARLMCAVIRVLPNGLAAREGSLTFAPELLEMKAVIPGAAVCTVVFLAVWVLTRRWYVSITQLN